MCSLLEFTFCFFFSSETGSHSMALADRELSGSSDLSHLHTGIKVYIITGSGEVAQRLRALVVVLPEDLCSIPSTHMLSATQFLHPNAGKTPMHRF